MPDDPMTAGQVAALFSVTTETVGAWADSGQLPCFRTPGGHRRFHRVDVEAILPLAPVGPESEQQP